MPFVIDFIIFFYQDPTTPAEVYTMYHIQQSDSVLHLSSLLYAIIWTGFTMSSNLNVYLDLGNPGGSGFWVKGAHGTTERTKGSVYEQQGAEVDGSCHSKEGSK